MRWQLALALLAWLLTYAQVFASNIFIVKVRNPSTSNLTNYTIFIDLSHYLAEPAPLVICTNLSNCAGTQVPFCYAHPQACNTTPSLQIWAKIPYLPANSTVTLYVIAGGANGAQPPQNVFEKYWSAQDIYQQIESCKDTLSGSEWCGKGNYNAVYLSNGALCMHVSSVERFWMNSPPASAYSEFIISAYAPAAPSDNLGFGIVDANNLLQSSIVYGYFFFFSNANAWQSADGSESGAQWRVYHYTVGWTYVATVGGYVCGKAQLIELAWTTDTFYVYVNQQLQINHSIGASYLSLNVPRPWDEAYGDSGTVCIYYVAVAQFVYPRPYVEQVIPALQFNISVPSIVGNQTFTVNISGKNLLTEEVSGAVEIVLDGAVVAQQNVTIPANGTVSLQFTVHAVDGKHTLQVVFNSSGALLSFNYTVYVVSAAPTVKIVNGGEVTPGIYSTPPTAQAIVYVNSPAPWVECTYQFGASNGTINVTNYGNITINYTPAGKPVQLSITCRDPLGHESSAQATLSWSAEKIAVKIYDDDGQLLNVSNYSVTLYFVLGNQTKFYKAQSNEFDLYIIADNLSPLVYVNANVSGTAVTRQFLITNGQLNVYIPLSGTLVPIYVDLQDLTGIFKYICFEEEGRRIACGTANSLTPFILRQGHLYAVVLYSADQKISYIYGFFTPLTSQTITVKVTSIPSLAQKQIGPINYTIEYDNNTLIFQAESDERFCVQIPELNFSECGQLITARFENVSLNYIHLIFSTPQGNYSMILNLRPPSGADFGSWSWLVALFLIILPLLIATIADAHQWAFFSAIMVFVCSYLGWLALPPLVAWLCLFVGLLGIYVYNKQRNPEV